MLRWLPAVVVVTTLAVATVSVTKRVHAVTDHAGIGVEIAFGADAGDRAAPPSASPSDLLQIHQVVGTFQQAASTKNLNLMMSLFADDATLVTEAKTYSGKEQVRTYFVTVAGAFQPQNHWVAYTPAYKIRISVYGDRATLYFECLYVDAATSRIKAHAYSDSVLVRISRRWLIAEMISL